MNPNLINSVGSDQGNGGGLTTFELIGGGDVVVHDFLTQAYVLLSAYTGSSNGPSSFIVDDSAAPGDIPLTVGQTGYIWDIVEFHWESFIVGTITNNGLGLGITITTLPWAGISNNYAVGSIISSTPPLNDAYWIVANMANDSANTRAWIIFANDDANTALAALTSASLAAAITGLTPTPELIFHLSEALDSPAAGIGTVLHLDSPIPDATAPCRFMAVLTSGADSGATASGEIVLYHRDKVSNALVALTLA